LNDNQNELQKRLNKASQNVLIFLGTSAGMATTTVFMAFMTGMSYGTLLSASLTGTFIGLMLASRRRADRLKEMRGSV
jgi:hypothetical protein